LLEEEGILGEMPPSDLRKETLMNGPRYQWTPWKHLASLSALCSRWSLGTRSSSRNW